MVAPGIYFTYDYRILTCFFCATKIDGSTEIFEEHIFVMFHVASTNFGNKIPTLPPGFWQLRMQGEWLSSLNSSSCLLAW
jgi:hypothetical protein